MRETGALDVACGPLGEARLSHPAARSLGAFVIGVPIALAACGSTQQVGDPGGKVVNELGSIRAAVPSGAVDVHVVSKEPKFTSTCYSTAPNVNHTVTFISSQPISSVRQQISRSMGALGWVGHSASKPEQEYSDLPGYQVLSEMYIDSWHRRLPQGLEAIADLEGADPLGGVHSGHVRWLLGAESPPVNAPKMHCG